MILWCIHGNLQRPSVWDVFDGALVESSTADVPVQVTLHKENLWELGEYDFNAWTSSFLSKVVDEKPWVMGYSLGGRLAWHAILAQPERWGGAIIIASHPGIEDAEKRPAQLALDEKWAQRFKTEPWNELLAEWDRLPVFGGFGSTLSRQEKDYPRAVIGKIFTGFSKARQEYLVPRITRLNTPPMLYVTGEYDSKYRKIGNALAAHSPRITHVVIPEACHRVPWENTSEFTKTIQYFIDSIH